MFCCSNRNDNPHPYFLMPQADFPPEADNPGLDFLLHQRLRRAFLRLERPEQPQEKMPQAKMGRLNESLWQTGANVCPRGTLGTVVTA